MKSKIFWLALVMMVAVAFVAVGCKGKAPKETKTITIGETKTTETTTTEVTPTPEQPVYQPTKHDDLVMLDDTLGAAEKTLGWDNTFCSITLDKAVGLFNEIQPAYAPGSADRNFVDASITDVTNIMTWVDDKISKGEAIDPNSADAKDKKKKLADIRAKVRAMIAGPAPKKEPIPEWKGDLMKKKWHERGEMMKKKWAERDKK